MSPRFRSICSVVLATTLLAAPAAAQQGPAAAPPAAAPAPAPATGTVRLSVRSFKNKGKVKLFTARTSQAPQGFVCQAPCKADVYPGTPLLVTYNDDEQGHEFVMDGKPGSELDLEVRPASKGALAGGIVLCSVGGLTALIGLLLVAVAGTTERLDSLTTPGLITLAVGGGLTVGGIFMIAGRSTEPRVKEADAAAEPVTRASLFAESAAPRAPVPSAFAPLSWGVSF